MNILFIGPYRQADGWGKAAKNLIDALSCTNHNIKIQPVFMSNRLDNNLDHKYVQLEYNVFEEYDIVIQNVLPHLATYDNRFRKNIVFLHIETSKLQYTSWPYRINLMDEAWVSTAREKESLKESGVTTKISIVKQSVSTDKFIKNYEPLKIDGCDNKFKFYFIGDFIPRKGIADLLIAYNSEFSHLDNVFLLLKTTGDRKVVEQMIEQTRKSLGLYAHDNFYPKVGIITDYVPDSFIDQIHYTCDCLVMPSYGEGFCLPVIEALGFGNTPIITDKIGPSDYINESNGYLVDSHKDIVFTANRPLSDLYTGNEIWFKPNILSLRKRMREAYTDRQGKKERGIIGQKDIMKFAHNEVAKELEKIL